MAEKTDSRDMVIIHSVFRRELRLAPDMVRAVPDGDTTRSSVVAEHLTDLLDLLHHHHEGEDQLLWPKLRERAAEFTDLFDSMDADHGSIGSSIDAVQSALRDWAGTADRMHGDRLAEALDTLLPPLVDHLDREEARILPLVDQLLTPEEWGELGARGFGLLPPQKAMIVLGQMAEDTPEENWDVFFSHLPEPVQQAYTAIGAPAYLDYVGTVRG
ncbi:hemerythrin domain-containing protein [Rhodococcoides corynebacterioides]|uniref:hemerythrin domain-containing protein n=1 Tax=Rhodococcoides corynebacterioides TaxID=53972 RepID=UPI0008366281|nr:hemerythrin domain-containing protein [Rhodococcus corynebacterioides]